MRRDVENLCLDGGAGNACKCPILRWWRFSPYGSNFTSSLAASPPSLRAGDSGIYKEPQFTGFSTSLSALETEQDTLVATGRSILPQIASAKLTIRLPPYHKQTPKQQSRHGNKTTQLFALTSSSMVYPHSENASQCIPS